MSDSMSMPQSIAALRLLLVDDDEFVLDLVNDMLRDLGVADISRALEGSRALAIMDEAAELPQLLICDLNMPGMDGIEFFRHLARRQFKGAVVLSSGSDKRMLKTVEKLLQAHQLRFLGTLQKPIRKEALFAMLMRSLDAAPERSSADAMEMLTPEEMRAGIEAGCVETYFQPKVSVIDRRVLGAECLVRWRHPRRGLVPPATFISVAEQHGLIDSLTMAVYRQAMAHLATWTRQGHALKVSVNVSMDNLNRLDLPEEFAAISHQAGVDPSQVMLEMTESRLMTNLANCLDVITRFRLKGFGLSVDDFGTGYSSMEKLKLLPFTELKVDRAFVFAAADDEASRSILELSVQIGRALGMRIVAEGAETQADWDMVAAAGCDEVQGYVVAKPMPAQELIAWKTRWESQWKVAR